MCILIDHYNIMTIIIDGTRTRLEYSSLIILSLFEIGC